MTSNAGTQTKSLTMGFSQGNKIETKEAIKGALKEYFRPEFLNRIDEVIVFNELDKDVLKQIVDLMLQEVELELNEKQMRLKVTEAARGFILDKGYSTTYGARPLRRAIQTYIEDEIAELYLKNILYDGCTVSVSLEDDELSIYPSDGIKH